MAQQPDDRIEQALKFIKKGQYQKARYLLHDIQSNPKAKKILKKIEGRNDKLQGGLSAFYSGTILVMIGLGIVSLIIVFNVMGTFQDGIAQRGAVNASFAERGLEGNQAMYVDLVYFCYDRVEGIPDSCMDWAQLIVSEYTENVYSCVFVTDNGIQYRNRTFDDIATCYQGAGIPDPS